jgi:hypothetical protein
LFKNCNIIISLGDARQRSVNEFTLRLQRVQKRGKVGEISVVYAGSAKAWQRVNGQHNALKMAL